MWLLGRIEAPELLGDVVIEPIRADGAYEVELHVICIASVCVDSPLFLIVKSRWADDFCHLFALLVSTEPMYKQDRGLTPTHACQ